MILRLSNRVRFFISIKIGVPVHETLKLENRNWKFGLHAFVLLMNAFNLGPSLSTIVLYSVAFDSDKTFLLMSFRNHDLVSSSEPLEYR